jgi:hypothetical protein
MMRLMHVTAMELTPDTKQARASVERNVGDGMVNIHYARVGAFHEDTTWTRGLINTVQTNLDRVETLALGEITRTSVEAVATLLCTTIKAMCMLGEELHEEELSFAGMVQFGIDSNPPAEEKQAEEKVQATKKEARKRGCATTHGRRPGSLAHMDGENSHGASEESSTGVTICLDTISSHTTFAHMPMSTKETLAGMIADAAFFKDFHAMCAHIMRLVPKHRLQEVYETCRAAMEADDMSESLTQRIHSRCKDTWRHHLQ